MNRPMNPILVKMASSRLGAWFFVNAAPPLDRAILRLSKGRFGFSIGQQVLLLNSIGAKSGQLRSVPLLYIKDGERFILIASKGGNPRHPAWYFNLKAKPDVSILIGGKEIQVAAYEAEGEERARLWDLALTVNPGYATYQERASQRRIPVMVLAPRGN